MVRLENLLWESAFLTFPLLSIEIFRISSTFFETPIFFVILLIIFFLYIIELFVSDRAQIIRLSPLSEIFILLFLFFIFLHIINTLRSADMDRALKDDIKLISCFIISITLILRFPLSKQKILISLMIFSSTILIGIYLFRYFFILKAPYLSIGWSEISEHGKNQMGLYLAIVTPFIFWKNIYEKFSFYNLLSLLIHISAVLYTLSRGTWISLFASIVVATIIFLTKKEKLKINLNFIRNFFLGILIVAVLFFYFYSKLPFSDVFRLRLQSIFSLEDYANRRSISLRKEYIRTSIDYFAGNPLFGIGTSNFYGFTLFVNHNDYLQILCEQGIIGFVTFLGILFVILYCLFNVNIKEYESLSLINSSLSIILYFNFVNTYNVIIIYVIWSMLLRQNLRRKM